MENKDIFKEWTASIDLTKTRVVKFPSLIFLCGGPISTGKEGLKSCRDIFYRYVTNNSARPFREQLILAEQVFRYFDHSAYRDLLRFEEDIAELSVLTIIFSESPGALAELGSFAVLKAIREKLLVVVHQDDADKESFIWRGPVLALRHLAKENEKEDPIFVYNWRRIAGSNGALTEEDFSDAADLAETIEKILSRYPRTMALDVDRLGHVMLLMLEILDVIQLANADEIADILEMLEIVHNRRSVEQHLSLLVSLDLAIKKPYRHNVYYMSTHRKHWLSWGYRKESVVHDVERWRGMFTEYYLTSQVQKSRALRSYMKTAAPLEVAGGRTIIE